MATGTYGLDRWRRILHNMKPKKHPNSSSKRLLIDPLSVKRKKDGEAHKKKLSSIVNKILAAKNQEEPSIINYDNQGDDERTEDNYNIY